MDPIEKSSQFLGKNSSLIIAGLSTAFWGVLFFIFLYWAIMTDRVNPPIPTWLDLWLVFLAYWLPLSALVTIICIWVCYHRKSPLLFYCNLIPLTLIVFLIPIFLLVFTLVEYLL